MSKRRPSPKVIVRRLPGNIAGLACKQDNTIEIDPDIASEKLFLEVLAHEALHLADWGLSERKVKYRAKYIAEVLWRQGYRKKA
jgi:predicted SprT family Zn-dependent metalloprotease